MMMTRAIPNGRIGVSGFEQPKYEAHRGIMYRKLTKKSWNKLYRSLDEGLTWHRTSSEAFWAAFHAGKLTRLSAEDQQYLANGGMILA